MNREWLSLKITGRIDRQSAETIVQYTAEALKKGQPVALEWGGVPLLDHGAAMLLYRRLPRLVGDTTPPLVIQIVGLLPGVATQLQLAGFHVDRRSVVLDGGPLPVDGEESGIPCPRCEIGLHPNETGFFHCPGCAASLYFNASEGRIHSYETLVDLFSEEGSFPL